VSGAVVEIGPGWENADRIYDEHARHRLQRNRVAVALNEESRREDG
jgi:hypothetical protein